MCAVVAGQSNHMKQTLLASSRMDETNLSELLDRARAIMKLQLKNQSRQPLFHLKQTSLSLIVMPTSAAKVLRT